MKNHPQGEDHWPSVGVLVACVLLLVGGYVVAILRGPLPAQEVRLITVPTPAPSAAPEPVAE